jgi:hypothetical protein
MSHQDITQLIVTLSRRLQKLKEQKATYGTETPPHILLEIEDVEAEIEQLQLKLEENDDVAGIISQVNSNDTNMNPQKTALGQGIIWLPRVWWVPIIVALIGLGAVIMSQAMKQEEPTRPEPTRPPLSQTFQYSVKVQAKETGEDIPNVRVIIEVIGQAPLDEVTDSNGFARVFIDANRAGQPGRLIVQATGYKKYTQNIDLLEDMLPEIIQLEEPP